MSSINFLRVATLLAVLGGVFPQPAEATDPFYLRLLERGIQDLELGLAGEARQKLRTASFGLLDEPNLLAKALLHLGRAQAFTADSGDLVDTVLRLAELEERFGAYSAVNEGERALFEGTLRAKLPETMLASLPPFAHLTAAPAAAQRGAEALTPKQRRRRLEQQFETNPEDHEALFALARLHHAEGKSKLATRLLDRLLAADPGHKEALCLQAGLAIGFKECAPALAGLDRCAPLTSTDRDDAFVLECLISAGRSVEASAFLEKLPSERRDAPKVARTARRLVASPDPGVESEGRAAEQPRPSTAPAPAETLDPPSALTEIDSEELETQALEPELDQRILALRTQVRESRFREQLEDALEQAIALASDYPNSPRTQYLAAEVAYLAAEWQLASDYFARAPRPGADRPELLFYLAVATFELGNAVEAASILRDAIPQLVRNPFVDSYIEKILASPPS